MSHLPEKIMFGVIGLAFTIWVGYHAYDYYNKPIELETVFEYTVSQNIIAEGIAIRDEMIIDQPTYGIENYLFEDAARVSVGQTVAEFYDSSVSDRNIKRMRELESEIAMLSGAQDKNVNNFSNADTLNRDIRGQVGRLSTLSSVGEFGQARQIKSELVSLLNRRQIATAKADSFSDRIRALTAEYKGLENTTSGESMLTVTAPRSGYFVKTVDGYEQYLSSRVIGEYKIEDYLKAIRSSQPAPKAEYAGKILTSHVWYFAASAKKYNIEYVKPGQQVQLEFPDIQVSLPAKVTDVLADNSLEDAVILLECSQLSPDIVNLRTEDVIIRFTNFTGLRINSTSIRFVRSFSAEVRRAEAENGIKKGQHVQLEFSGAEGTLPAVVTGIKTDGEAANALVTFECKQVPQNILDLGGTDVLIHITDFTGLKIIGSGMGFGENQRGVYVLDENMVRFKKADPIYEEQGFVLSSMNIIETPGYDPGNASLFARVITKGTDLYDGKPVQ
ncbi:hypothetical protein FACS1894191_5580 [Clostridia bacterium]|nr:hypothetical protein FACS1894191_5580 [Clostridia bacterium]